MKLGKFKLKDARRLTNSEMRNIVGAHNPTEYTGYWDCVSHCMTDAYTDNGFASMLAYASGFIPAVGAGVAGGIGTMCLIACEEYGWHFHY